MSDGTTPPPPPPGWNQQPQQPGWTPPSATPTPPGPPQGFPQPGYPPQQGFPQPGYPPHQGFPQPGFPQQGFPQQAPGGWAPGPELPKKKRKWPWVLLAIFLLMVLGIGACTAFVWRAVSGVTDVGNEFVEALYEDPAKAAGQLCPTASDTPEELAAIRQSWIDQGWTGGKSIFGVNVSADNGNTEGALGGTIATNPETSISILLDKTGGEWCVDSISGTDLSNLDTNLDTDISIPDISIPDISIPDLSIPDVSVPA
jgi:hypothetical protein